MPENLIWLDSLKKLHCIKRFPWPRLHSKYKTFERSIFLHKLLYLGFFYHPIEEKLGQNFYKCLQSGYVNPPPTPTFVTVSLTVKCTFFTPSLNFKLLAVWCNLMPLCQKHYFSNCSKQMGFSVFYMCQEYRMYLYLDMFIVYVVCFFEINPLIIINFHIFFRLSEPQKRSEQI